MTAAYLSNAVTKVGPAGRRGSVHSRVAFFK
jgi:hypothetical protein